ncbi:MAG: NEAT domain-containing protein, partial [Oscillospiraceae bacterium]|nr:NEAT domain-containing protein [Oscillospiraceae bacterium]
AIEAARALLTGGDGYLETSYRALERAVAAAEAAQAAEDLTEEETAAQIAALTAARAALAASADLAVALADGTYPLADKTRLWNYSMNQASMGDPAIDHTKSSLTVEGDKTHVHLFFGPMEFAGTSGYLQEMSRFEERYLDDEGILNVNLSTLVPAAVHAVYEDVTDDYGPTKKDDPEHGAWYPKEISLEVTPGEEYTYVYVTVPVMGDSANQPARLRIDWSGFALGGTTDMAALETALTAARAVHAADCTEASYAALAAGIAAAEALKTQPGVTQVMADARAAALDAARAALRPAETPEDPPDGLPDGVYEVPYTIQNAFLNQPSMADMAVDGPATVIVAGGAATYLMTFKARVTEGDLRGHLLTLWNIPGTEPPTGAPEDYEKEAYKADVIRMAEDKGMDGEVRDYPRVFSFTRAAAEEPYFYVRVDVDAMGESHQAAKIVPAWDEARPAALPDGSYTAAARLLRGDSDAPSMMQDSLTNRESVPVTVANGKLEAALAFGTPLTKLEFLAGEEYQELEKDGETDTYALPLGAPDETVWLRVTVGAMPAPQTARFALDMSLLRPVALGEKAPGGGDDPGGGGDDTGGGDPNTGGNTTPKTPANGTYRVSVALWHQSAAQTSMGNDAFTGQGLLTVQNGVYRLQTATAPVNNNGYSSALTAAQYDIGGGWRDARAVETGRHMTTTKFDGVAHEITYLSVFEIDLKNTTDDYVNVRMKVPYTPMDEVTADGWMYARLKIDWSTLTRSTGGETVLTPEETPLAAPGDALDLTDAATGIRLKAAADVLPAEAALEVTAVTSGAGFGRAETALTDTAARFVLYDIAVRAGGAAVQPDGAVTVHIPLPEGFDSRRAALYRVSDDGTATLVRGAALDGVYLAPLTRLGLYALAEGLAAVPSPVDAFADVADHWAYDSIRYAVEKSLFEGVGADAFAPDRPMTRAMFVTVLGRLAGADRAAYTGSPFDDVAEGQWHAPYVAWARDKGIVDGVGDNRFAPDRAVTRQEMATILHRWARFADAALPSGAAETFADAADIGPWAREGVEALTAAGFLKGVGNNRFAPQRTATRAEAAALLARLSAHIG